MRTIHFNSNRNQQSVKELVESDSMFVLRTRILVDVDTTLSQVPGMLKHMHHLVGMDQFPESRVYLYKIVGHNDPASLRDEMKRLVRESNHPMIEYIGSVLKYPDTGIYQIYTGNLFIKLSASVSELQAKQFLSRQNLHLKHELRFSENAFFVEPEADTGRAVFELAEELLQISHVHMCHPELVVRRKAVFESVEIDYSPSAESDNWIYERIKLFEAWKHTKGAGVKICVIDDGIDFGHPAFAGEGKIPAFRDMHDRGSKRPPAHQFAEAHGTACAGIAVSVDPRAIGIAPDAQLIPIRSIGLGSVLESEAFCWAADNGADIISCSWGPPDGDFRDAGRNPAAEFPIPDHTDLAIRYAASKGRKGKGCLIFFAAGNGNERVYKDHYASHDNVMAIGATNHEDEKAIYSDYGNPLFCSFPSGDYDVESGEWYQTSGVTVPDRLGDVGYVPGDIYRQFTGTSASCPGMAGVAALALSIAPDLTREEARELLKNSCRPLGDPAGRDPDGRHNDFGYGLIEADKAVLNALKLNPNSNSIPLTNSSTMTNSKTQPKAYSLHIGINDVSQSYYKNYITPLSGCVNDMNRMKDLALSLDFDIRCLENEQATRKNILASLSTVADYANPGDLVMITYAGHGAPIEDLDGDESDGHDEAWVTYDGFLLDDQLFQAYTKFKPGVRILMVSDSCHSGTMSRSTFLAPTPGEGIPAGSVPRWVNPNTVKKILDENDTSISSLRTMAPRSAQVVVQASVKLLAACQDNQYAFEVNGGGMFTTYMLDVYDEYANSDMNYSTFLQYIKDRMPVQQSPKLTNEGVRDSTFDGQFPFSLTGKGGDQNSINDDKGSGTEAKGNGAKTSTRKMNPPSILVDTASDFIEFDGSMSTRSTNGDEQPLVKVTQRSIAGSEITGSNAWDKAYNLVLSDVNGDIDFAEPDLTSNINGTEEKSGHRSTAAGGGRLPTYPPYERVAFDWHLDQDHSQLKAARELVFPNLITGEKLPADTPLVKIVHIDTGYYPGHPALPENLKAAMSVSMGADGIAGDAHDDDAKFYPSEQNGHGNATMALLAGGKLLNEHTDGRYDDYFGAIPFAQVYSVKISETVVLLKGTRFAAAVDYAIEIGADVITMSMAGWPSKVIAKAVNRAYEAGIIIVSAGGNTWVKGGQKLLPKSILYPARFERTIAALGATYDHKPYLWKMHNVGARAEGGEYMQMSNGPQSAMTTAIAAYTPNVIWFGKEGKGASGVYTDDGGGTSSATPQVAAAAALYLQHYRDEIEEIAGEDRWKRVEIVKRALFESTKQWKSAEDTKKYYGNGILQALDALEKTPAELADVTKSKEARVKGGFFKKLFGLFKTRGLDLDGNARIHEMMNLELMQLAHRDAALYDILEEDLTADNFDFTPEQHNAIVNAVRNSEYASEFLKQHIISAPSTPGAGTRSISFGGAGYQDHLLPTKNHQVLLRTNGLRCTHCLLKEEVEIDRETGTVMDEIEVDLELASTRSTNTGFSIATDLEENGRMGFMLVEKEVDGEKVIDFVLPNDKGDKKKRKKARSMAARSSQMEGEFTIDIPTDLNAASRGPLRGKVGKLLFKLISWKKPKGKNGMEQFENFLSTHYNYKHEVVVFDLKSQSANNGWVPLTKAVTDHINKESKPVLICTPGLASTVDGGFSEFLGNTAVASSINKKYCRYVLGFNMPTIIDSVAKNAEEFTKLLKGKFNKKKCAILARSRGGILGRYLFEREWVNNTTGAPLKSAPFVLDRLIMVGTPNEGTPIANEDKWTGFIKVVLNIVGTVTGLGGVGVATVKVITAAIEFAVDLDGINDLELKSELILNLNRNAGTKSNYFSGMSNYEPRGIKKLLDATFVDRYIFGRKNVYRKKLQNDSVVPVLSGLAKLTDGGLDIPEANLLYRGTPRKGRKDSVSHFAYLDTVEENSVKQEDEFVNWVIKVLSQNKV